ncbi:zinc finger BED domain-containing protein 4-like isoform X2 [Ischnura elegans]|uniref:zinc finger BED domain-containing protein 4-like isoform X2 n=1 Tax=Ischnura elegans TaxID=197161 RepID=UPI001ED86A91|nr:zinc finger BED domain-containing protein 4-like isoform X2 [Ischnura elegans]
MWWKSHHCTPPPQVRQEMDKRSSSEVSDKSDRGRNKKRKSKSKRRTDDYSIVVPEKEISVSPISEPSLSPSPPTDCNLYPDEQSMSICSEDTVKNDQLLMCSEDTEQNVQLLKEQNDRLLKERNDQLLKERNDQLLKDNVELSAGVMDVLDGHDKVNNAIVDMIIRDDVPWKVMESGGFNFILKTFVPSYIVPSRASVSEMIGHKYLVLSSLMKERLNSVDSVAISTEFWEGKVSGSNNLIVSAHYASEGKCESLVVGMIKADGNCTADGVKDSLLALCNEWNISVDKISALVTSSHSVLHNAALQLVGKARVLICFAEQLNRVAQRVFEDDEVKQLCVSVRNIVTFFKENPAAYDDLRENHCVNLIGLLHGKNTWFSNFMVLDKYVKNADAFEAVLKKHSNSPQVLDADGLSSLRDLVNITNSLYLSSCELQKEDCMPCSKVIPLVCCLRSAGLMLTPNTLLGKLLAQKLLIEITGKFRRVELVHILAHATLLDPKYKEKYFQDKVACLEAKIKINQMLGDEAGSAFGLGGAVGVSGEGKIWDFHDALGNRDLCQPEVGGKWSELQAYLSSPVSPEGTDAIEYWSQYSKMYPKLSKIALKYLSVAGVAVTSKKLLTTGGMEAKDCEELSKILFLKSVSFPMW